VAAFLHHLTEKRDIADTVFLVDAGGYSMILEGHGLSDQFNYPTRTLVEEQSQTVTVQVDCSHSVSHQKSNDTSQNHPRNTLSAARLVDTPVTACNKYYDSSWTIVVILTGSGTMSPV